MFGNVPHRCSLHFILTRGRKLFGVKLFKNNSDRCSLPIIYVNGMGLQGHRDVEIVGLNTVTHHSKQRIALASKTGTLRGAPNGTIHS